MISHSMSSSPASGSVLTTQSLEPAWDSVSPSLSATPPLMLCLSLSQKQIKTFLKKRNANPHALPKPAASKALGAGPSKLWINKPPNDSNAQLKFEDH